MSKFLFILLFGNCLLRAQNGPAGVGNSANNVFWIKADKGPSSLVNGTPISAWNDQSGNFINMSQAVTAQQPVFTSNVINGFPAILFDNVNTSGLNDKMTAPDSPNLDNTSAYTFFTVSRPLNLNGEARVIVSKRTTVAVDQSFMLFYFNLNRFHVDIQTNNNRFNSASTFSVNNNYIIDMVYDGSQPMASRSRLYLDETLDVTAAETSSIVPDNTSPLVLGSTDLGDQRPFGGYIAEVVIYRAALVQAQRTIVNNYLSSKYNITLSANDKYAGDNPANGDYDKEVAGIGLESTGGSSAFASGVSGGMGLTAVSGFANTDYILAGHATDNNAIITTDVGGMTGTNNARWQRIWYIDVTNIGISIGANIEFGASDGGTGSAVLGNTASDYVLLYRVGQTGNWTELATASSVFADRAFFNGITISNDGYYTLGTKNFTNSVLPIELQSFNAKLLGEKVALNWVTASEKNNALFTVEKTANGETFETVVTLSGAGNSLSSRTYQAEDTSPYRDFSYYRLKQTDFSGNFSYSDLVAVYNDAKTGEFNIYPNPSENIFYINSSAFDNNRVNVQLNDASGKNCFTKMLVTDKTLLTIDTENKIAKGAYLVIITFQDRTVVRKIIIK